jgi:hypothetical protein
MKLDDFVSATNLARYQRMLAGSRSEAERETIRKLLAEELARRAPIRHRTGRGPIQTEPEA